MLINAFDTYLLDLSNLIKSTNNDQDLSRKTISQLKEMTSKFVKTSSIKSHLEATLKQSTNEISPIIETFINKPNSQTVSNEQLIDLLTSKYDQSLLENTLIPYGFTAGGTTHLQLLNGGFIESNGNNYEFISNKLRSTSYQILSPSSLASQLRLKSNGMVAMIFSPGAYLRGTRVREMVDILIQSKLNYYNVYGGEFIFKLEDKKIRVYFPDGSAVPIDNSFVPVTIDGINDVVSKAQIELTENDFRFDYEKEVIVYLKGVRLRFTRNNSGELTLKFKRESCSSHVGCAVNNATNLNLPEIITPERMNLELQKRVNSGSDEVMFIGE